MFEMVVTYLILCSIDFDKLKDGVKFWNVQGNDIVDLCQFNIMERGEKCRWRSISVVMKSWIDVMGIECQWFLELKISMWCQWNVLMWAINLMDRSFWNTVGRSDRRGSRRNYFALWKWEIQIYVLNLMNLKFHFDLLL